jgi:hypothetical protein
MGAVFDLPEDIAKELLALPLPPGDEIQAISKVGFLLYSITQAWHWEVID